MPTQNHAYRHTALATPLAALYSLHPKPYTLKSFTFSAKERDVETGLSYFGSRYYSSDLSIWLSVDPMAAKYPSLSPYVYCANNPVKLVDPNGEEVGNYYDVCGNYIGKDGIDDNEVYIVTDGSDLNTIESRTNAGKTIQLSEVNSAMRLPLFETRKEIYSQLDNGEKSNAFAEHGGIYGIDLKTNKESARAAAEGLSCIPCNNNTSVSVDYNTVDCNWFSKMGTYHSHPSGEKNGSFFIQNPSSEDYTNANNRAIQHQMIGTNMVFGMKDKMVYLYNAAGNKATISLETFLNIR